jgi:GTP cyclohydrolase I
MDGAHSRFEGVTALHNYSSIRSFLQKFYWSTNLPKRKEEQVASVQQEGKLQGVVAGGGATPSPNSNGWEDWQRGNIESSVREILAAIPGENHTREGLLATPERVARAYMEDFFSGYLQDPADVLTTFDADGYDEMILVRDIPFFSSCEHHMVPFHGVAHVGYIPDRRIVGLSKLSRVVDVYARRLQVQERLTAQIADAIEKYLQPKGTMVVLSARHLCMEARGIRKAGSHTVTSAIRGVFGDEKKGARQEFLRLVQ